ncbi:RNA-directed DNA polymerase from mobile element jockey [Trichonephila clavipes]|nr:RNA-directed DNA polymerase from mobile element jockey [Trichonephila clavipes]
MDGTSLVLPSLTTDKVSEHAHFLILSLPNNEMLQKSPFAIHKAIQGISGEPKSVKKLRSGDLLIETSSALQTKSLLLTKTFLECPLIVNLHRSLNSCRESDPTASNGEHFNAPEVPQCAKRNSRNRRKRPKVQKAEIKTQMAPHRPRKSTPTELTTDEEDMIMYDVQAEELEPNPEDKFAVMECFVNNPSEYMRALTPTRFRNSSN